MYGRYEFKMSLKTHPAEVTPRTVLTLHITVPSPHTPDRSSSPCLPVKRASRLILVSKHLSRSPIACTRVRRVHTHIEMASFTVADQVLVVVPSNVPSMDIKDYVYATPTAQQQSAAVLQLAQAMFTAFSCQHPFSAWGLNGKSRFILVVSAHVSAVHCTTSSRA